MRHTALFLIVGLLCGSAHAQDFFVKRSTPVHGQANVSLSDTVGFSFNRSVDNGTNWNKKFVYEPSRSLTFDSVALCLTLEGTCTEGDDVPRHVRYQVEHEPNTDYSWLVYAVRSAEGDPMTEPYVLRYTTAEEIGQGKIKGRVTAPKSIGKRTAAVRTSLHTLAEGLKQSGLGQPLFDQGGGNSFRPGDSRTASGRPGTHFGKIGRKAKSGPFTQILLIDKFSVQESHWTVRAADVIIGSSGSYTLDFVRSGSYVPIAVRYTDGTNTEIDALGFYDPDGDGTPNSVDVHENQRTDIDLQLFGFPLTTARAESNLPVAVDSAARYTSDQELRWVRATSGMRPAGTAYEWTYHFYSPSKDLETEVTVNPLEVIVDTSAAPNFLAKMRPIPDDFVDSDDALQLALGDGGRAFLDQFRQSQITTVLEGGNLHWMDAPDSNEEFWRVKIFGSTSSDVESFERYVNMETGAVLPVELVDFEASVDGKTVRLRWRTVSETNNAGFAVQHKGSAETAAWTKIGFVEGAGTTQKPQTYRFRTGTLTAGLHRFRLKQVDTDGTARLSRVARVRVQMEAFLRLTPPTPNPVRRATTLRFGLKEARRVTIALYDALGRRVRVLYEGTPPANQMQNVRLETDRLSGGIYFVRLRAGDQIRTCRLTVVK